MAQASTGTDRETERELNSVKRGFSAVKGSSYAYLKLNYPELADSRPLEGRNSPTWLCGFNLRQSARVTRSVLPLMNTQRDPSLTLTHATICTLPLSRSCARLYSAHITDAFLYICSRPYNAHFPLWGKKRSLIRQCAPWS